jgi:tetratricopeptide (TPR) repeat protein/predicted aspartyl protease
MNLRASAAVLAAILSLWAAAGAARDAGCHLSKLTDIPVTLRRMEALVTLKLNGTEEIFVLDSGAFYSSISAQTAAELKLPLGAWVNDIKGVGGTFSAGLAKVRDLTIYGVTIHNREFIAGGTEIGVAGLLGQDFLHNLGDVEYDFANGVVRLWRTKGCDHGDLAYWVKDNQPYNIMHIDEVSLWEPHTRGDAYVNGARIHVLFDSGAGTSVLSLRAAERAGVKPGAPGVQSAGYSTGLGQGMSETWIAPFASFKVGDEEIQNTHLRIGNVGIDTDMLLGFDFFLSHRIFVATSQSKLYFTYNGGPVFDLTRQPRPAAAPVTASADASGPGTGAPDVGKADSAAAARASADAPGMATPPATPAAPASAGIPADPAGTVEPTDAPGYRRRAAILVMRRDYEHAIADLTRAIELTPADAQLFRDRATAYANARQVQLARSDLDHFLTLQPGDVSARIQRASLALAARQAAAAIADLDAASAAAPKEDNTHMQIGQLYQNAGQLRPAIREYDLWLASHTEDAGQARALMLRCSARAELGEELDKALSDCNAALRRLPAGQSVAALQFRGLTRLRRGELDKAIEDSSAALKLAPQNAFALYQRGLARVRKGAVADGQADQAAARAVRPAIEDDFKKLGITP